MLIRTALIFYDHLLTIIDEVRFVWRRQMSLAPWIFIANRVLLLVYATSFLVQIITTKSTLVR